MARKKKVFVLVKKEIDLSLLKKGDLWMFNKSKDVFTVQTKTKTTDDKTKTKGFNLVSTKLAVAKGQEQVISL